jgi:hypothetical protein
MAGGPPRVRRILRTTSSSCSDGAGHLSTGRIELHQLCRRSPGHSRTGSGVVDNRTTIPPNASSDPIARPGVRFWAPYCDEAYALLSDDFLTWDKTPAGIDLASLEQDLVAVTG